MAENPFGSDIGDIELPMLEGDYSLKPMAPIEPPKPEPEDKASDIDLKAKLRKLQEREAELKRRQEQIKQVGGPTLNWPSFFPILRYDPEADLTPSSRKCAKTSLIGIIVFFVHAIFNVFAVISVSGLPKFSFARCIVFAIIQGIVAFYVILNFGYKKLYLALMKHDIPISVTLIQFAIILWCIYLTIGFPDSGCVGIALLLDLFTKSKSWFSKLMGTINVAIVAASLFFQFSTLVEAQKYQKVSGHDSGLLDKNEPTQTV